MLFDTMAKATQDQIKAYHARPQTFKPGEHQHVIICPYHGSTVLNSGESKNVCPVCKTPSEYDTVNEVEYLRGGK